MSLESICFKSDILNSNNDTPKIRILSVSNSICVSIDVSFAANNSKCSIGIFLISSFEELIFTPNLTSLCGFPLIEE